MKVLFFVFGRILGDGMRVDVDGNFFPKIGEISIKSSLAMFVSSKISCKHHPEWKRPFFQYGLRL